jgi:hypothetical protein
VPYLVLDESLAEPAPVVTIGAPLSRCWDDKLAFMTELADELGMRTDVPADSTQARLWLNWAYRNVSSMLTLKELSGSFALSTLD